MDHQSFGRGGGLSYFVRGNASEIDFVIESCTFHNNSATLGGGLLIELLDNAYGNHIAVRNTHFCSNFCPFTTFSRSAGGGIRFSHYVYGLDGPLPITASRNELTIDNCIFFDNIALYGGGISVSWALQNALPDQVVSIHILESLFQTNYAKLGVAVHVDQFRAISHGFMATVWIENSNFTSNSDQYYKFKAGMFKPVQVGFGVVCVTSSNVWFRGNVKFTSNNGSALAVIGGTVNFNGSYALFADNKASKGAGIVLLGESTIVVGYGSKMVFDNNFVTTQGGAIHVVYNSRQNLKTDSKCFIRHVDPTITPDNWNVSMEFTNNVGFKGSLNNSIFVTSLLSCSVLGGSRVITAGNKSAVFCWKGWAYYTSGVPVDCESQIASDIGNITYSGGGDAELRDRVQTFPGWNFDLPLAVWDDFHSNISDQTVFSSTSDISEKSVHHL